MNNMMVDHKLYIPLPTLTSGELKALEDDTQALAQFALTHCDHLVILAGDNSDWELTDCHTMKSRDGRNWTQLLFANKHAHGISRFISIRLHKSKQVALQETHDRRFKRRR